MKYGTGGNPEAFDRHLDFDGADAEYVKRLNDDWQVVEVGIRIHPDEPTDVMVSLEQNAFAALARLREREAQLAETAQIEGEGAVTERAYRNAAEARAEAAEARVAELEAALSTWLYRSRVLEEALRECVYSEDPAAIARRALET